MNTTRSSISYSLLAVALALLAGCATRPSGSDFAAPSLDQQAEDRVDAQAHYATGLIYELRNDTDKALDEYVASIKADPSNEDLALEVSRRLLIKKDLARAIEITELVTKQPDASAAAFAQLGMLYAEAGRQKEAEKANRKAIELAPDSIASYYNLYALRLSQGQEKQAREVLEEAAKRDVKSADYWLDLAELYANFLRSKPTERDAVVTSLKTCLERANKLGVSSSLRRLKLADGYALAGDTSHAVDILLDVLEKNSDDLRIRDLVRQKLLAIYISNQDADGALKQLEAMVKDHPTNPQANYLLASVAADKAEEFRKKANDHPDQREEFSAKAKPFAEKAEDYFRKSIQLKPDFEQAYYSLTPVLMDQDKNDEALDLLATAREKFPKSFAVHYYSAAVYARKEDHAKAVTEFTQAEIIAKATNSNRLDHVFYFQMGAQLERNKQYEEAAATFKKALDLKPDFAPALNYLGFMWADLGEHLEEARKLIQKAVDLEPKNAAYLDSLAWVLYRLDQPNLALTYMEDALKYQEEPDATLFDHLGDIQKAAGQPEAARESWRKSLAITADPAVQKKLDTAEEKPRSPEK